MPSDEAGDTLIRLEGITKSFPGVLANDQVSLEVHAGKAHALLGENGAGKSTLVKMIFGLMKPDSGQVFWRGQQVNFSNPQEATVNGLGMVYQHFALFEAMTVAENIAVVLPNGGGHDLKDKISSLSQSYGLTIDPDRVIYDLSVGERQRVEILRALIQNPSLLILDEPTSVLTPQEVDRLFNVLAKLKAENRAILYISHKLEEVRSLCEECTILRRGKVVGSVVPEDYSAHKLAEMMIGENFSTAQRIPNKKARANEILRMKNINVASETPHGINLKDVSLTVFSGEILGIAGVAGNGQSELMEILSGERTINAYEGTIIMKEQQVNGLGPRQRRRIGGLFVPDERNGHATSPVMSLIDNMLVTGLDRLGLARRGILNLEKAKKHAEQIIQDYDVRTTGSEALAGSLSGGNLQKYIMGREISQDPALLVINQPTWGVDAGAAAQIRQKLIELAGLGVTIVIISQDLDEIIEICDQIAVLFAGHLSPSYPQNEITVNEIGLMMGGGDKNKPPPEANMNLGVKNVY